MRREKLNLFVASSQYTYNVALKCTIGLAGDTGRDADHIRARRDAHIKLGLYMDAIGYRRGITILTDDVSDRECPFGSESTMGAPEWNY